MKFDEHHPIWTAYVLNELTEKEKRDCEAILKENDQLIKFVDDLKMSCDKISAAFGVEHPEFRLNDSQKETIRQSALLPRKPGKKRNLLPWLVSATAACITISVVSPSLLSSRKATQVAYEVKYNAAKSEGEYLVEAYNDRTATVSPSGNEAVQVTTPGVGQEIKNNVPVAGMDKVGRIEAVPSPETGFLSGGSASEVADAEAVAQSVAATPLVNPKQIMNPERPVRVMAEPSVSIPDDAVTESFKGQRKDFSRQRTHEDLTGMGFRGDVTQEEQRKEADYLTSAYELPPVVPDIQDESYMPVPENAFIDCRTEPLSTFSIDVDTASYSNMRRFITGGQRVPLDAIRIEEWINYFPYSYSEPERNQPFSVSTEISKNPWNSNHYILRVGLKGQSFEGNSRPASNFVFLIDSSGSMSSPNKLPLLVQGFEMMLSRLGANDYVSIVAYAGSSGVVLPKTRASDKQSIIAALRNLRANGSTHGSGGIEMAYRLASQNFIKGGVNRVILATDGDFNVGVTSRGDLLRMIEDKAKSQIFLTVLGFGMGNYKDATLELLADKGNGNYAYIDTAYEAKKVLVDDMSKNMITIAKDVKIQVDFNPAKVGAYRLIGYENRILQKQDFNDDKKDAGEIGAGHTVTALYEIIPANHYQPNSSVQSKYVNASIPEVMPVLDEVCTVNLRYKLPHQNVSSLISMPVKENQIQKGGISPDLNFQLAVAGFGLYLRNSQYKGSLNFNLIRQLANAGISEDTFGYRNEFIGLVNRAATIYGEQVIHERE